MQVDETGRDGQPARVDDPAVLVDREARADGHDHAVLHADVDARPPTTPLPSKTRPPLIRVPVDRVTEAHGRGPR